MSQTDDQREEMARRLAQGVNDAALQLARESGARRQRVDGSLREHEERLDAINGSIARGAAALEAVKENQGAMDRKIDRIIQSQVSRDEVDAARAQERKIMDDHRTRELRAANEKQITTRQFVFGILTLVLTIILAVYAKGGLG